MVKKAGTVILLLTVLILTAGLLTACGPKKYKITITSGEDLIDECPKLWSERPESSRTIVPMNLSCLPQTLKWKLGLIHLIMMRMVWDPDS